MKYRAPAETAFMDSFKRLGNFKRKDIGPSVAR